MYLITQKLQLTTEVTEKNTSVVRQKYLYMNSVIPTCWESFLQKGNDSGQALNRMVQGKPEWHFKKCKEALDALH